MPFSEEKSMHKGPEVLDTPFASDLLRIWQSPCSSGHCLHIGPERVFLVARLPDAMRDVGSAWQDMETWRYNIMKQHEEEYENLVG
jgi:hypothetical protein